MTEHAKTCPICETVFPRPVDYSRIQWLNRRFCSKQCSEEQKRRVRTAKLRCKSCGGNGPFHSYKTSSGRISRHNRCVACRNEARRPKRKNDKERAYGRRYMKKRRDKFKAESPERIAGSKAWGAVNPERYLFTRMRSGIHKDGERRRLLLSYDEFLNEIGGKVPGVCPVFGLKLDIKSPPKSDHLPTVDRIDSSKPYQVGNIAVISWRANIIKNMGTADEHRRIADWMDALKPRPAP